MRTEYSSNKSSLPRRSLGWLVHMFTASGACIGVLSLLAIYEGKDMHALWLMAAAILIDSVDGMFARLVKIQDVVPEIDGALLDNIVDFVNYTIVPCFFCWSPTCCHRTGGSYASLRLFLRRLTSSPRMMPKLPITFSRAFRAIGILQPCTYSFGK